MLQFAVILLTSTAAYLGAPWWAAVACAGALFATSPVRRQEFDGQLASAPMTATLKTNQVVSAVHALAAASSAYGLGLIVRLTMGA